MGDVPVHVEMPDVADSRAMEAAYRDRRRMDAIATELGVEFVPEDESRLRLQPPRTLEHVESFFRGRVAGVGDEATLRSRIVNALLSVGRPTVLEVALPQLTHSSPGSTQVFETDLSSVQVNYPSFLLDDVDLVLDVEEEFGVSLPEDVLGSLRTLGELHRYLMARLPGSPVPETVWARMCRAVEGNLPLNPDERPTPGTAFMRSSIWDERKAGGEGSDEAQLSMMLRGPVQACRSFLCHLAPEPRIICPERWAVGQASWGSDET